MTRRESCHLLDMLAKLRDPRKDKGKRHPLKSILALMVIGLMCGHKGYTSIATWARSQPALAKALSFTHKKTPCASTIHNLLKRLDVVVVEETLTQWVKTVIKSRPDLTRCLDAVAIDGKTMRASQKSGATTSHLLSVVSHELGVTLTQRSVSDKTNEIPISTEILNLKTEEETHKVHYGITSLNPEAASAKRLLALRRGHWSIENKSHWMRDTLLGEDASPVRCGAIPQVMAALRNTALSVFRFAGITRIADKMNISLQNLNSQLI